MFLKVDTRGAQKSFIPISRSQIEVSSEQLYEGEAFANAIN